jgi:hypothetical protein
MPKNENAECDPEKVQKDYEEWESSLEGIHYALDGCLFASDDMEILIVKTLHRLPKEVREFVYENCSFKEVDPEGGHAFSMKKNRQLKWLILLGSQVDESLIAHEIAHAWLGHHYPLSRATVQDCMPEEIAAWTAVKGWGWDIQTQIDRNQKLLDDSRKCRESTAERE